MTLQPFLPGNNQLSDSQVEMTTIERILMADINDRRETKRVVNRLDL